VTGSPLDKFETEKAIMDMGGAAYHIYRGARIEGASRVESLLMVQAWFAAMVSGAKKEEEDDESDKDV
jgi:hypothetical protein